MTLEQRPRTLLMVIKGFCGMVNRQKALNLICRRYHNHRVSPLETFGTSRAGFEPALNMSLNFVEVVQ